MELATEIDRENVYRPWYKSS